MSKRLMGWPLLAALLSLAACGGRTRLPLTAAAQPLAIAKLAPAPAAPEVASGLPGLPQDQRLNPLRMTASANATQAGDAYTYASSGLIAGGGTAQLNSSANSVAWTIYLFGGTPGEAITDCGYAVSGLDPGETVFCAISDYQHQRWAFLPTASQANASFTLPDPGAGHYQSPLGNTWIAVATFGGTQVDLTSVHVTYTNRHSVSGQIVDKLGAAVPGVTVATTFAGVTTTTDASGNYTLAGLADGVWPIMASLDGWAFYSDPTYVVMAGADLTAPMIVGDPHGSRFTAKDLLAGNNSARTAPVFDLASGPLTETISADDDPLDFYRFTVQTPGTYILRFANPQRDIHAPFVSVSDIDNNYISSSAAIFAGDVGVSFTVNDTPRDLIVEVRAAAGGGTYTLTLLPEPGCLFGGALANGLSWIGGGTMDMTYTASGHVTTYFLDEILTSNGADVVYDDALPAGAVTVAPQLAGYTFAPLSAALTLAPGPLQVAQFGFTPPAAADSFEPNNTTATATSIALPYVSAVPLQVSGLPGGDTADYYKFSPTAGKGFVAQVSAPNVSPERGAVFATLLDHNFNNVGTMWTSPQGVAVFSNVLADGNVYYLLVTSLASANELISYSLLAAEFDGYQLQFKAAIPNPPTPLDNARFVIFAQDFNRLYTTYSGADGRTAPLIVPDGTQLRVDCYRYGMALDSTTQLVTMPPADTVVEFSAPDQGDDALEPNGDYYPTLPQQALPLSLSATISDDTDAADIYKISAGDGRPLHIVLSTASTQHFYVFLYDETQGYVGSALLRGPLDQLYLPNDGNDGQYVRVELAERGEAHYNLAVDTADAYAISGFVQNTIAVGLTGVVTVESTHEQAISNGFGGGDFHINSLYPPGTYTLAAFVTGFGPTPDEKQVTITNADASVTFNSFMASPHDNYEPNDSAAQATAIAYSTPYTASVSSITGNDGLDYYKLAMGAGDRVRIKLTVDAPWEMPSLYLLGPYVDGGWQGLPATLVGTNTVWTVDYTTPEARTAYLYVNGEAHYTLQADKLN